MDTIVKTSVQALTHLLQATGKNIENSEELAKDWTKLIAQMQEQIKSYKSSPFAKVLTWTTCGMGALYFMYKMGLVGKIPNFVSTYVSYHNLFLYQCHHK